MNLASGLAAVMLPGHRYSPQMIVDHHQDHFEGITLDASLLADLKKKGKSFCDKNHIYHGSYGCVALWMLSDADKSHNHLSESGEVSCDGLSDPMAGPSLLANKLHTKKKKKTSKQGLW